MHSLVLTSGIPYIVMASEKKEFKLFRKQLASLTANVKRGKGKPNKTKTAKGKGKRYVKRSEAITSLPAIAESKMPRATFQAEMKGNSAIISGKDMIQPVTATAGGAVGDKLAEVQIYLPEMGNNTRIKIFSGLYQRFNILSLKMHFVHCLGTQYTGSIMGWATDDCNDVIPNPTGIGNVQKANAYVSMRQEPLYKDLVVEFPQSKGTYYCTTNLYENDRMAQPGMFNYIYVVPPTSIAGPVPAGTVLGYLWLEYKILFSYPHYSNDLVQIGSVIEAKVGVISPDDVFHNANVTNYGNCRLTTQYMNQLCGNCPGTLTVNYGVTGTINSGGISLYDTVERKFIQPTKNFDALAGDAKTIAGWAIFTVANAWIACFPQSFGSAVTSAWASFAYLIDSVPSLVGINYSEEITSFECRVRRRQEDEKEEMVLVRTDKPLDKNRKSK
jgi:hypothetical protein